MNLYKSPRAVKDAQIKYRDFNFEVKEVAEDGRFSGYASVFGVLDVYREVVAPGAFAKSLALIAASGDPLPALWQHRAFEPVGGYDKLEEDARGLHVAGFLLRDEVPEARKAYALMKARIVRGLSIGYYVIADSYNEKDRVRTLLELDLVEVSIVTFAANPEARIDLIKSKLAHGSLPTIREFEGLLREQGFSKTQAEVIATRGLKHLLSAGDLRGDCAHATTLAATAIDIPTF